MGNLYLKKDNNYLALKYSCKISNFTENKKKIVIPNFSLQMNITLFINGKPIKSDNYNGLSESIGNNFLQFQLWQDLGYEPSLFVAGECSFSLKLKCLLFTPLENDFRDFDSISTLESINVNILFVTEEVDLYLTDIINGINVLFSSQVLQLEMEFPLCFSFYGRQFFKINYNLIVRVLNEVMDFEIPNDYNTYSVPTIEKSSHLQRSLINLQSRILSEYNTIDIWKEYNIRHIKWRSYEQYKQNYLENNKKNFKSSTVKQMVYSFKLLSILSVENGLE